MRSLKKTVWSLFAVSALGLGICACGSEAGSDAIAQPITVLPVTIDAGPGCPGNFGCPCSEKIPCTQTKPMPTYCSADEGICMFLDEPCGNCLGGGHGAPAQ